MGETSSILYENNPIPTYAKFLFDIYKHKKFVNLLKNRVNQLNKIKEKFSQNIYFKNQLK